MFRGCLRLTRCSHDCTKVKGNAGFLSTELPPSLSPALRASLPSIFSSDSSPKAITLLEQSDWTPKDRDAHNAATAGPGRFRYEIVPEMVRKDAFDHVFSKNPEISVVLHTASPFRWRYPIWIAT